MPGSAEFSDFFYPSSDGLRLHARVYGDAGADRWPVVCLPGLSRNARDFHGLALYLAHRAARPRRVVAFDYRGRGQSQHDADIANYTVVKEADDVLTGLAALGIAEAAFVGTSRGGLIVHVLGALRSSVLKAIVLNDIGPAIEADGLRHIAGYLGRTPRPQTRADAIAAQKSAHGADFPALGETDWANMVDAIYREEGAGLVPDFDPKLAETLAGIDFSRALPTLWPQFDALAAIPMLAIRGAKSRLLSKATLKEMAGRHPKLKTITVDGQGHAPFLAIGALPGTIAEFIDEAEGPEAARS
ncbi:MAG: alpha/beta hydrolase [Mesorhizobium sp.]|nr:alpha/beta hydrolase [Mesorhizobium sp.]MBN9244482.1 alpha/beta hydrolase [Mesorhizobium sp.]